MARIWTDEEEEKFRKLLTRFGAETEDRWIWIAGGLPGRSEAEVERHFQEVNVLGSSSSSVLENNWTDEEEEKFRKLLTRYGAETEYRWIWIAKGLPGRSEAEVERHFQEVNALGSSSSSTIASNFSGLLPVRPDADVSIHSQVTNQASYSSRTPTTSTAAITNANPSSSPSAVDNSCPICLAKAKDIALGCGHTICSECATMLSACPICRMPIETRLKIYY